MPTILEKAKAYDRIVEMHDAASQRLVDVRFSGEQFSIKNVAFGELGDIIKDSNPPGIYYATEMAETVVVPRRYVVQAANEDEASRLLSSGETTDEENRGQGEVINREITGKIVRCPGPRQPYYHNPPMKISIDYNDRDGYCAMLRLRWENPEEEKLKGGHPPFMFFYGKTIVNVDYDEKTSGPLVLTVAE